MLIFCNKCKLLHEKRVQSRQYCFFLGGGGGGGGGGGVYQHGRRVVLLLLLLFLFCSPCHRRRGRGQVEFPHLTYNTLTTLMHQFSEPPLQNYIIHDPFEISEVN